MAGRKVLTLRVSRSCELAGRQSTYWQICAILVFRGGLLLCLVPGMTREGSY